MLLTSGQLSVAISSGVGKSLHFLAFPSPGRAPPGPPSLVSLIQRSLHLHNPLVPLRLRTAATNRTLHTARPTPTSSPRNPHHQPGAAETFRATARLRRRRRVLREISGQEQAAGRVGQGSVCAAGATAFGSVRGGNGDAGGGAGGKHGAADHPISEGVC